jgi:hypothetical protein
MGGVILISERKLLTHPPLRNVSAAGDFFLKIMRKSKNGRPSWGGFGGNSRHGERRCVCGNRRRVHYSAVIRRFFYAGAEMCIAGAELIAYGAFAIFMIACAVWSKKRGEKKE